MLLAQHSTRLQMPKIKLGTLPMSIITDYQNKYNFLENFQKRVYQLFFVIKNLSKIRKI